MVSPLAIIEHSSMQATFVSSQGSLPVRAWQDPRFVTAAAQGCVCLDLGFGQQAAGRTIILLNCISTLCGRRVQAALPVGLQAALVSIVLTCKR